MEFWRRVKKSIKDEGTTQEWVASQAKVPFDKFRRWASRPIMPNADQAVAIARALNTTVEYLVEGEEGAEYIRSIVAREGRLYRPPDRIVDIVEALERIDDNKLETVRTMVVALAGEKGRLKAEGS